MLKVLIICLGIFLGLFILSIIIYFFNIDVKVASLMEPILNRHYDKIKRDKGL